MNAQFQWIIKHVLLAAGIIYRRLPILPSLAAMVFVVDPAFSANVTWTGAVDSNWSNQGNWQVGEPLNHDSVTFGNTAQTTVRADFSSYPDTDPLAFNQPPLHLESVTFATSAPSFLIDLYSSTNTSQRYNASLALDGSGVANQSLLKQNVVLDRGGTRAIANGDYEGIDGSQLTFNNGASAGSNTTYHALGGLTTFHQDPQGIYFFLRPSGGKIVFNNDSSAASASFVADGGAGNGGVPALVEFHDGSTAANAILNNQDGAPAGNVPGEVTPICGFGGQTIFYDNASAATATFNNVGQSAPNSGGTGGITNFRGNSTAANAVIHNQPATAAGFGLGAGGVTQFFDHSTAASATIVNEVSDINHGGGSLYFTDDATAASANIDNRGGTATYGPGTTIFDGRATAANATITNAGLDGGGNGGVSASTIFRADSSAGTAIIHNLGGQDVGGRTEFDARASAANSHIILEPGPNGGTIIFKNDSTAGSALLDAGADGTSGTIAFHEQSTAANSLISLGANSGSGLRVQFYDSASAGQATITARDGSNVQFLADSTAANAKITVYPYSTISFAGSYEGGPVTSAGSAAIYVLGGNSISPGFGSASFGSYATASSASFVVEGAQANDASPGRIAFGYLSNPGNPTILLKSSPLAGSPGGGLYFNGASPSLARIITETGSLFYITGDSGASVGSLEGAGETNLNGSLMTVGALGLNTTVSGRIYGYAGSLTKVGVGTLTLTGNNTYPGLTTVEQGILIVNGSVAGGADVKDGATLKGTAFFGGMVTCEAGSKCAPGTSPGTFTLPGLNLLSGSTLEFELGTTRDHIVVTNSGNVNLGGVLDLSILPGFDPAIGQTFSLFEGSIGSITGAFSAVNTPTINGHTLNIVYGANQVMLVVGNAGDFNGDGKVDAGDYVVWRKGLGTTYTQNDYNAWRGHFGQVAGGSSAIVNHTVPEATNATLFVIGFAIVGASTGRSRFMFRVASSMDHQDLSLDRFAN